MRILIVGNFKWDFYEKALKEGFEYFDSQVDEFIIPSFSFIEKFTKRREIVSYNHELVEKAILTRPDFIFIYRSNEIFNSTLRLLKKSISNLILINYHNDNPYNKISSVIKYINFINNIKCCDLTFVYRASNIQDAVKWGAKRVSILMPYIYSKIHFVSEVKFSNKVNDVVYIGHYEKDGREEYFDFLIKNNVSIKIYGPGWEVIKNRYHWPDNVVFPPVYGKEYQETISNSKIALCFFSKKHNDIYTRRLFEIPAAGTLMATINSSYVAQNFTDQENCLIFSNKFELLNKLKETLNEDNILRNLTISCHNHISKLNVNEFGAAKSVLEEIQGIR